MSTLKTLAIGETYEFSMGLRGIDIPVGATQIHLKATLVLPSTRPPGSLWPIVGPAFGNVDKKRVKPATMGINKRETWRLEGPGIQGQQTGSASKVPWGKSVALEVLWEPNGVQMSIDGVTIFNEDMAAWDSSKGGILWVGVEPVGEYSQLQGAMLRISSLDFGLAGEDPGTGGGGDARTELDKAIEEIERGVLRLKVLRTGPTKSAG